MSREPFLEFFTAGKAVPQPNVGPGAGGHVIMASGKHSIRSWRDTMKLCAQAAMRGSVPVTGPIRIEVLFLFQRPKSRAGQEQVLHDIVPDLDKLWRAVNDSMKRVVWWDDAQVSTGVIRKRWAHTHEAPGVVVRCYRDAIPWK